MDFQQRLRATIVSTVVRDTQREFWRDIRAGARQTYSDVFEEIRNDANIAPEQRIDMLYQVRHFRMEHLLARIARQYGWLATATLLVDNNRHYVYVSQGAIGLTQAYVSAIGAMPQPARYRERHALINELERTPRLDLGDGPVPQVAFGKEFYGLLAHNPIGKRFEAAEQALGMIQVCVPKKDMLEWLVELTIEEIIGGYETETPKPKPDRRLQWKKRGKEEEK
jgi:hypothetical protein